MTFRTASATQDISGASFFQMAYTDNNGEITSFTSGTNQINKYYKASTNQVLYKKIIPPYLMILRTPDASNPFTTRTHISDNGTTFTSHQNNVFGNNIFCKEGVSCPFFAGYWWAFTQDWLSGRFYLKRSSDGISWTTAYGNASTVYLRNFIGITNGTMIFALNNDKVISTTDGVNFTTSSGSLTQLVTSVNYFDGKYLFTSQYGAIVVSSDLNTFSAYYPDYDATVTELGIFTGKVVGSTYKFVGSKITYTDDFKLTVDNVKFYRGSITAAPTGTFTYTEEQVSATKPDTYFRAYAYDYNIVYGSSPNSGTIFGVSSRQFSGDDYIFWDFDDLSKDELYTLPYESSQFYLPYVDKITGKIGMIANDLSDNTKLFYELTNAVNGKTNLGTSVTFSSPYANCSNTSICWKS